jgi:hypothetical protein
VKRWGVTAVALATLELASCGGEDRGFALCLSAQVFAFDLRDRLMCARRTTGLFPPTLRPILDSSLDGACGGRREGLVWLGERLGPDGLQVEWGPHLFKYTTQGPREGLPGGGFALSVVDERRDTHYESYWVDHTGVLRVAEGREATQADPPVEGQRVE